MTKLDWNRAKKPRKAAQACGGAWMEREAARIIAEPTRPVQRLSGRQQRAVSKERCHSCLQGGAGILITSGVRPDGTLKLFCFCRRECAARGGFLWAGR